MTLRRIVTSLLSIVILLGVVNLTQAQAQGPEQPPVAENNQLALQPAGGGGPGPVDAGFTYQGQLKNGGTPVTGSCDFRFSLWNRSSTTDDIQLGVTETQTGLQVTNGLFTTVLNFSDQFGAAAFNGQARWLQIEVRCPTGSGTYTTLGRQPLWAAPYASTLRPQAVIESSNVTGTNLLTLASTGFGRGLLVTAQNDTAVWAVSTNAMGLDARALGSGTGVGGSSVSGIGVHAGSTSGTALYASGTGRIHSVADSKFYVNPQDMMARADSTGLTFMPQDGGGMLVSLPASAATKYLMVPVPTFGTLFGSTLYVKSLRVCYVVTNSRIDNTSVSKNEGSTVYGEVDYIADATDRSSSTFTCYTVNATTPRTPIDNTSWVQFDVVGNSGATTHLEITTIELTLTEQAN